MKVGMNLLLWTDYVDESHYPLLEKLKAAGFDGVEVPLFKGTPEDYRQLGQKLKDHGLGSTTVTVIGDAAQSPVSEDAAHRQAAVDYLKWAIECTAALGGEALCGPYHQPLGQFTGEPPTETERDRAAEVHRQAAEIAQQHGVVLAMEYLNRFEAYMFNTLADAAEHVKKVNHPSFGTMYDTFHANIEEKDPVGVIGEHMDVIRHVHISENDRGTPGRGNVPWQETFEALRKAGYDGWLTIEAFGRALPALAAATCVWRDFFPSLDQVYQEGGPFIRQQWEQAGSAAAAGA